MAEFMIMAEVSSFDQLFAPLNRLEKKQKYGWLSVLFVITLCITEPSGRVDLLA